MTVTDVTYKINTLTLDCYD